jgi:iron complex outermembrane receptor protein
MFSRSFARLTCAVLAVSGTAAFAADAPPATSEAETDPAILVVGQRDRPIEIAPRGLSVSLGEEQFAGVNAFNVEDLMKYAPNFFVRKRFIGDSNGVPGFRGTHSTQSARTLVMLDGFVVSNFLGNSFGFSPKWGAVGPGEVRQFDIVYGPYSSRYVGNSMGGIVNITTKDPEGTEAFVTSQGFVQPYRQYATDKSYPGYSVEGGFALKQKDGPLSLRFSSRLLQNRGQPMSWYFLASAGGTAPGTAVTGAVLDPATLTRLADGNAAPVFAAQSPADITQSQTKLKLGYDDGAIKAQALLIYWWNLDRQFAPECYLRDSAGNPVCEGRVTTMGRTWTAAGADQPQRISRRVQGRGARRPIHGAAQPLHLSNGVDENLHLERLCRGQGQVSGNARQAGTDGLVYCGRDDRAQDRHQRIGIGRNGQSLPHRPDAAGHARLAFVCER